MGNAYVSYQLAGPALHVLNMHPNDWTLVTHDPFKRTYTYDGFEITIVGDFGIQTDSLADDTQIFFIEYFNASTGEGARISGLNIGLQYDILDITVATDSNVIFHASDQPDNIDVRGAEGASVMAHGGNDLIYGSNQRDTIDGGAGNDTISGSGGSDTLTGGQGEDVFRYRQGSLYIPYTRDIDRITDFSTKDDHFDFRKFKYYDYDPFKEIRADFVFIGRQHFSRNGDELRFVQTLDNEDNPVTFLYGNLDRDKRPEFAVELDGHIRLRADDFYL